MHFDRLFARIFNIISPLWIGGKGFTCTLISFAKTSQRRRSTADQELRKSLAKKIGKNRFQLMITQVLGLNKASHSLVDLANTGFGHESMP